MERPPRCGRTYIRPRLRHFFALPQSCLRPVPRRASTLKPEAGLACIGHATMCCCCGSRHKVRSRSWGHRLSVRPYTHGSAFARSSSVHGEKNSKAVRLPTCTRASGGRATSLWREASRARLLVADAEPACRRAFNIERQISNKLTETVRAENATRPQMGLIKRAQRSYQWIFMHSQRVRPSSLQGNAQWQL